MEPGVAPVVYTLGYSGRTPADFVDLLRKIGVQRLVDVRAVPFSRKKGFSKRALAASLAERGIEYVHLPSAGNPFRADKTEPALARYAKHLDAHPEVVADAGKLVGDRVAALLCLESDARMCHRSVLAQRLADRGLVSSLVHL